MMMVLVSKQHKSNH